MPVCRFLCLALSRRDGGYCAAGLDLDTGAWIRPLNARTKTLGIVDILVLDSSTTAARPIRPFDMVALPLDHSAPAPAQPENWILQTLPFDAYPQVIGNARRDDNILRLLRKLASDNHQRRYLFGNEAASVAHPQLLNDPLASSLCLIQPRDLVWIRSTDYHGRPRILARFHFGSRNLSYCLPVTDVECEQRLLDHTSDRSHEVEASSTALAPEVLFTVSLGENFARTDHHYKLIAGVLEMPQ